MKIKVSEIPEEGLDLSEALPVRLSGHETQAAVEARVEKSGSRVLVKGTVTARMELQCSRCLREFEREVSVPVDLVYRPVEEIAGGSPEIAMEDMDIGFYKADELDTGLMAAEQILLSVPMKVLCSEACKGMCPGCGRDLNVEDCVCPPEVNGRERIKDIRLAEKIKKPMTGGTERSAKTKNGQSQA